MDTVTLYRINCYHAPREELIGESFSLVPWDEDDATMKGEDDGGKDYELPKGYELSAEDGVPVILNPDGQPCGLQGHNGCPLLIDEAKKLAILVERDKTPEGTCPSDPRTAGGAVRGFTSVAVSMGAL